MESYSHNILQRPNGDIHYCYCALRCPESVILMFRSCILWSKPNEEQKMQRMLLGLFYFFEGKSNINVKSPSQIKARSDPAADHNMATVIKSFLNVTPPSAARSKPHVEHCSLQVKAQAERLPETRTLRVNEASNKNPTTLNSSRETDALETILKTSSSASPQSRNKFWSTNYP